MTTKHKANSEYLSTLKQHKPFLCKCKETGKYFVSVFFSKAYLELRGFKIIK